MSNMVRFTDNNVSTMSAKGKADIRFADKQTGGALILRIQGAARTYQAKMKARDGRTKYARLGKVGEITLERARKDALDRAGKVADGKTVGDLIEEYLKQQIAVWRPRTAAKQKFLLEKFIKPAIGGTPIRDLTKGDVLDLVRALSDRPNLQQDVRTAFTGWYSYAGDIHSDCVPNLGITSKTFKRLNVVAPPPRDRVFNEDEIKKLWRAADGMGWPYGAAFQLMLLTGARPGTSQDAGGGEVFKMRWADIDFDAKTWTIAPDDDKSKRGHVVPLSDLAISVLNSCARIDDTFVFASGRKPGQPVQGQSKAKTALGKAAGVDPKTWRWHDCRRTARTGAAALGYGEIWRKVQGHAERDRLDATYDHHDYLPEMRQAVDAWATKIEEIVK